MRWKVLLYLIVLHTVTGHPVLVNPDLITSVREYDPTADQHFVAGPLRCLINTSDGKFTTVIETCDQVRMLVDQAKRDAR